MSKHHAPRPAQRKRASDDLVGGLFEKTTNPDSDFRLLERNPGMARRDYTDRLDRAVRDEQEAIDSDSLTQYARENNARFGALRADEKRRQEHQTLQSHLREFCREAQRRQLDPPELDAIRSMIDAGRQRLKVAA